MSEEKRGGMSTETRSGLPGDLQSALQNAYDMEGYPEEFTRNYVIMECLAERNGIDTFLVQGKEDRRSYVAKCYDRTLWSIDPPERILQGLSHEGLPKLTGSFSSDAKTVTIREYVEGVPLDRYAEENELDEAQVVRICLKLCDILSFLHGREEPIIHRDIKPQNVIVGEGGQVFLIDFDIARIWRPGSETDTRFFGTVAYAPPEQYGFSQTDARADIYSLGVLLRYLLTGSTRENKMIRLYKPLQKIIDKCTAFAPEQRYSDIGQVKQLLLQANPAAQRKRAALRIACALAACLMLCFAGIRIYEKVTYDPFNDEAIPAFVSDQERIADAVSYMRDTYDTDLFDAPGEIGTVGLLRQILIDVYGLDPDYVRALNQDDLPQESDDYFLPWGWSEEQTVGRDTMVYAAVKVHDPSIVADWSSLPDDTGEYPGTRVALAFAEKTGILTGANRPDDITVGDMALILANTDRVFSAAEGASE